MPKPDHKKSDGNARADRNERLARQLRANLKKRKQQIRQRETPDEADAAKENEVPKPLSSVLASSQQARKD